MKTSTLTADAVLLERGQGVPTDATSTENVGAANKFDGDSQAPSIRQVRIADLCIEGNMQIRVGLHREAVEEYTERMRSGDPFPPVIVYRVAESYLLVDGFHRVAAAKEAGLAEISCEIRLGARRDALVAALGANVQHGLRRTNADKRRAVEVALAEFAEMSDRAIAEMCGVGNQLVGHVREELCDSHTTTVQIGKDGKKRLSSPAAKEQKNRTGDPSKAHRDQSGEDEKLSGDEQMSASALKQSAASAGKQEEEVSDQTTPSFQLADGTELLSPSFVEGWITTKWLVGELKHIEAIRKPFTPMQKNWCTQAQRALLGIASVLNQQVGVALSPDDLYCVEDALGDLRNYVVSHPRYKHVP